MKFVYAQITIVLFTVLSVVSTTLISLSSSNGMPIALAAEREITGDRIEYENWETKIDKPLRFMPLGDSYTAGTAEIDTAGWPIQLTRRLKSEGIRIDIIENPAVAGYTTGDLLEKEMPTFEANDVDFVIVLIGANDSFKKVPLETTTANYNEILDRLEAKLGTKDRIITVSVPDYDPNPIGPNHVKNEVSERIVLINEMIERVTTERGITRIELFNDTRHIATTDLVAGDLMHPSQKEYSIWVDKIHPVVSEKLQNLTPITPPGQNRVVAEDISN